LVGDYVTIINQTSNTVDISGWAIGAEGKQKFTFPAGTSIFAGGTITIWTGKDADKKERPPVSFCWMKKNMWNNEGDIATLYNKDGSVVDTVEEIPPAYNNDEVRMRFKKKPKQFTDCD
jgi:hypothetical protein